MKTVQMLRVFTKSSNIIIILLLVLSQFGSGATRAAAADPKVYGDMVVGFIQTSLNEGGWRAANTASFINTANQLGITLQVHDGQNNQANQIAAFQGFIDNPSVNVIVLAPVQTDGWDTILQAAQTAGKVVVLEDRPVDSSNSLYATYVGPDFVEEGRKAGTAMCDLLNGSLSKNVVELVGDPGSPPAQNRGLGFREITNTCGITITQSQTANWSRDDGKLVMAAWLQASTDIQGVFAQNDQMGFGAIQAIKDSLLDPADDIKIVSVDAEAEAFRAMIAGDLNATVESNPLLAPQVYEAALRALNADPTLPKWIPSQEGVFYQADAATIYPTRYDYNPGFAARFPENQVHGYGWYPLGASITLTIDDPDNGVGVDHTDTQTVVVANWDPNETWVGFDLGAFALEPGQLISMTGGTTTKTHTVTSLTVTSIDPDADTVTGTAAPGSQVDVGHVCDENGCAFRRVITNGSGNWLADFSVVGEDGDEQDLFDIRPGTGNEARQPDADGDSTTMQWRVLNPYIESNPGSNWVEARDWPNGTPVTLTIDDPSNGVGVDKTANATMGPAPWNPNDLGAEFDLGGFDLQAGQLLKVTDGTTERTYTPSNVAITGFDLDADTITGTATPGMEVEFCVNTPGHCALRHLTSDGSGHWTADYAHPGARDDEQELIDLQPGSDGWAAERDATGNLTRADWRAPNPNIDVWFDDAMNSNGGNTIWGWEWPLGIPITVTVDDPDNGPGVDFTDTQTSHLFDDFSSDTNVQFDLPGFVTEAGQLVTMTNGLTTKTLVVPPLAVTEIDTLTDTISGATSPGADVNVTGESNRWVTADGSGHWTADFSVAGLPPSDPNIVDIRPGSGGWVFQYDESGDQTRYEWRVLDSRFHAQIVQNNVEGYEWLRGANVTLTIDDPSTGPGVDFTDTQAVNSDENVFFNNLGGLTLAPGMLITMTDGTTTKTHTVSNLIVTAVDPALDIVSGTGTPGVSLNIQHCDDSGCQWRRFTTVQPNGAWQVDFSVVGAGPDEQQILDITPGMQGEALQGDNDNDITDYAWSVPYPPIIHAFYLKASAAGDWVHAYGWQDGDPLTLVVDRPLVNGDVDYTATVNAGAAPWNASSPVADILGIFDLGGVYNLQPGDELTVTGAGHTETYTVPAAMTPVRWFIGLGAGSDPGQIPAEQEVADDFNTTHPNIELIAEVQPNPSARDTLVAEIAAGNPPDIVGPVGWAASGPFHGQWLDLAALISSTGFDTSIFNPEMVQAYQTDEGQVGLPFTVFPAAIFYQKSMFDAAGLHYPPAAYGNLYEMPDHSMVAWNFNTLTQVARLLTLDASGKNPTEPGFDKNNIVQYGYIPQWQMPTALGSFWGADTLYSGTPGNYTALIPSQWDAAWRWYYDGMWGNQPFIPNGPVASSQEFGWSNVFNSGKVAMAQVEAWYTCCINEAGSNWDLAALPAYNGTVHNVVHADTFRILQGTPNPDESFTVMAYLLTDGVAKLIPTYDAMPGRTSSQAAYFAGKSAQFPWVTNWQVLQAGLNYPDIPNNEAWLPNFDEAWNRVNSFGSLMADSVGLNMSAEIAALQTDLQNIFNANTAPVISDITNQVTDEDSPTGAIAFTIGDAEMPVLSLTVTASSSNPTLLPNANILIGGAGANRSLTLIPAANQNGAATVTVSVHDGVTTTSDTFVLTVNAVNDAPTISAIDNQNTDKNTSTGPIPFTVGDIETAAASLVVTASSSNTTLLPNANITLGGSGANRTISLTPAAEQSGAATITVNVSDGSASVSSTFALSVNALNNLPTISQVLPQQGLSSAPNDITIYGANFAEGVVARLGTTDLQTLRLGVGQLRATVPQGFAAGTYALTVTNPNGTSATLANAYTALPASVDDLYGYAYELWSDPSALRAGQAGQIGLVVHRQGGQNPLSNVVVRFFLGDPAAGTLLGNGSIPLLSPRGAQTTSAVNWTPATAGDYEIYAVIDPDQQFNETLESNNIIHRTITVSPAAADQLAPHVDSFVINDGATSITDLTVSLDTVASDTGGSGVASLQFVQYQYSAAADLWAPVQNSGWLDYATAQSNYAWNLAPANGVIYLQAWAMDHAGNVSIYPYGAYVSYLPPSESVAADQAHIYRYELSAGQSMTVRVTPISGDPDLYIWAPDYATRPPWVSNLNSGLVEEISINAPVAGTYQIEVYGYTAAEYAITVTLSAGPASHTTLAGPTASNKSTYTQPYVPLESEPGNYYTPPTIEPSAFLIYLPLVMR